MSITYEEIGLFPRSFSRVLDRFLKQVFSDVENLVIQEYRFYRYLFLTTLKCLLILFFIPFFVNFLAKTYVVRPLTEYFWNTKQTEIFLNSYQQKRAFAELKEFEEKTYFESLIFPKSVFVSSFSSPPIFASLPSPEGKEENGKKTAPSFFLSPPLGVAQPGLQSKAPIERESPIVPSTEEVATSKKGSLLRTPSMFSSTEGDHRDPNLSSSGVSLREGEQKRAFLSLRAKHRASILLPLKSAEGPRWSCEVPPSTFRSNQLPFSFTQPELRSKAVVLAPLSPFGEEREGLKKGMLPLGNAQKVVPATIKEQVMGKDISSLSNPALVCSVVPKNYSTANQRVNSLFIKKPSLETLFYKGKEQQTQKKKIVVSQSSKLEDKVKKTEPFSIGASNSMVFLSEGNNISVLPSKSAEMLESESNSNRKPKGFIFEQEKKQNPTKELHTLPEETSNPLITKGVFPQHPFSFSSSKQTEHFINSYNMKSSLFVYQTQEADKNIQQRYQEKTIELAQRYNDQSIEAITNLFADLISLLTLFYLLYALEIQINITKSFLLEVFFGLDDSKKSLLILLITDLLVGYHSSNLWELFFEFLFHHYGLPESQTGIFLLVATLPVLLDVLFKYLIFRHLNRSSPATVATYHAMIE